MIRIIMLRKTSINKTFAGVINLISKPHNKRG